MSLSGMDISRQKDRSTRSNSPPSSYPGRTRPHTSDAISVDNTRKRTERPASGSRTTRSAREHRPESATKHDRKTSAASSNSSKLSDLRKLLHVASELQKIDLEAALNIYKGLLKETNNDDQVHSEETYLEQLASVNNADERTALKERIDVLTHENEKLKKEKTTLEGINQQSKGILDVMGRMETESKQLKEAFKSKEDELKKLKEERSSIIAEKDLALNRLSKELGTKLSDNNPTIADLSDPNRAMKLGEKYNEMYDNEWTDAMEILCKHGSSEEGNVKKILDVLKKCYELCEDLSKKQMTSLEMVLLNPGVHLKPTNVNYPKHAWGDVDNKMISTSAFKQLKDCRKEVSSKAVGNIFKEHAREKLGWIADDIPDFVKRAIELCWLMCLQDPPVVIGSDAVVGSTFDTNVYKPYTNTGTMVSYNVWPPLLLHKDGPLLVKGIVQPIKVPRVQKTTREQKPRAPVVADRLKNHFGETYTSPYAQKRPQRESTTSPPRQYEITSYDRKGTSPPREKYYNGTKKNYEEHRVYNAVEDRGSPVHLEIQSSYGSRHDQFGTSTYKTYRQNVASEVYQQPPLQFEHKGRQYIYVDGQPYTVREYLQIYGTTRGVSEL